jgi:hypothetical protein
MGSRGYAPCGVIGQGNALQETAKQPCNAKLRFASLGPLLRGVAPVPYEGIIPSTFKRF